MSKPVDPLSTELATFEQNMPNWSAEEGRFALIAGTEVLGIFDTYQDAVTAGYKSRGLEPFLVKQILTIPSVANFTRNLGGACHTLAA